MVVLYMTLDKQFTPQARVRVVLSSEHSNQRKAVHYRGYLLWLGWAKSRITFFQACSAFVPALKVKRS
jgi:hypothetical protein